ncbi:MAG: hypothetical protein PHW13_10925 [Methylococcales bacterium]|nr:hypothetical protein [Methylococcales bacterium]
MTRSKTTDAARNVKNIAAVVYMLVLIFLVGGSYINQHRSESAASAEPAAARP